MKMHLESTDSFGNACMLIITSAIVADFRFYNPEFVAYVKMVRESLNLGLKEAVDYARIVCALADDDRRRPRPRVRRVRRGACKANIVAVN